MEGQLPNTKKWVVFYPVYINSKKTLAEGRRISLSKACENPTCVEIGDCCNHLKLPSVIEIDKAYPRDFMQKRRMRVSLKREDGTTYNPSISSNKDTFCLNCSQFLLHLEIVFLLLVTNFELDVWISLLYC
ncbi:hypothetical protein SLA2020_506440 [Shorea laevis]